MAAKIVLLSDNEIAAARAFNARMAAAQAPGDFIPEGASNTSSGRVVPRSQYVVLDGAEVRGGVARLDYPAWLEGSEITALNYQAPISEGIIDKRFGMTAMLIVKFMQQQGPHLFVVGMGDAKNPLPRLLKAAGWTVQPIPFCFQVCRPNRFLRELQLLRNNPRLRFLSSVAAGTGAGWAAIQALQARGLLAQAATRGYTLEAAGDWEPWVDAIWDKFKGSCSFGVLRDRRVLDELYPAESTRLLRFVIHREGRPVGWSVSFDTQMRAHNYFGDMRVGSILDCLAEPGAEAATVALTAARLKRSQADLIISNHSHPLWQGAFKTNGFTAARSNYLLAMSPALAKAAGAAIHMTRGDGDGRIHL